MKISKNIEIVNNLQKHTEYIIKEMIIKDYWVNQLIET